MAIDLGFQPGDFGPKTMRAAAAEFIATGLFVFIGCGSVVAARATLGDNNVTSFVIAVAIAHGVAIAVLVAATAHISGGHLNPAVSIATALTGRVKVSTATIYIIAQLAAAVLGALLLKAIVAGPVEGHLGAQSLNVYNPQTGGGVIDNQVGDGAGAGLLVEGALTFALVFVIYSVAVDKKGFAMLAPLAIGFTVMADHFIGVPMTGASMNPARSFGPAVAANYWADWWVFWIGPIVGGLIAALVYEYVFLFRREESEIVAEPEAPPPNA